MLKKLKKPLAIITLSALIITGVSTTALAASRSREREEVVLFGYHSSDGSSSSSSSSFTPSESNPYSTFKSWIRKKKEENSDVVGWLKVPGTNINSAIVQSETHKNNVYYNERDLQKNHYPNQTWKNYKVTANYLDYRVVTGKNSWKSGSKNTVIYGHNWTNLRYPYDVGNHSQHVMFGQLPSYKSLEFAKNNPYIYYSTENYEGVWKVFAAATCEVNVSTFPYNTPNPSEELHGKIIKEWLQRSDLDFGVDVNSSDRILTLSTCTREYSAQGGMQRYVVVARLLRPGESDTDPVNIKVNENQKKPSF